MDLSYWYLVPVSVVIASVANGAGVGGATFFSPLFVLVLRLNPQVAVGTALVTEVFGFASGVSGHARAKAIDWRTAGLLALVSVPAAVIGSLLSGLVPGDVLKALLGVGLAGVAVAFIRHHDAEHEDAAIGRGEGVVDPHVARTIVTRDGRSYRYRACRRSEGRAFAALGGLFVGLISTGLGEANSYALVKRCRIPTRVSVATSVAVVAVTAVAASLTHVVDFARAGGDALATVGGLAVFTVPGVVLGGQLGPWVASRVPERHMLPALGWLFLAVAAITLIEAMV